MARTGRVRVNIDADASGMRRGVSDAERSLNRLNSTGTKAMGALKSAASGAAFAIGAGLAAAAVVGTRELIEQEKVAARTANVLETTGNAAGKTAEQVTNLASKLQDLTGTEDDVIQAGANVILTFDQIKARGGIFDRTVASANDMSVALGRDMEQSARALGRALQDPERGLGALSRAGVTFTEKQRERIKGLAEEGRLQQAQAMILREVEKRYKGAAAAEGEATEMSQQAQRQFEDLSEALAAKVLPIVVDVANAVRRNWPAIERVTREVFTNVQRVVQRAMNWIEENIVPTIRAIVRTARAFWDRFGDDVKAVFAFVIRQVQRGLAVVSGLIKVFAAVLRGDWAAAWDGIKQVVRNAFAGVLDFLRTIPRVVLSIGLKIGSSIVDGIVRGIRGAAGRIRDAIGSVIPDDITPGFDFPGLATGGMIPGRFDGADDVPIRVSRGEVILNPTQQRMVGIDRIVSALRSTGGKIGGGSFATGGVAEDARQSLRDAYNFARAQLGDRYGRPDQGTGSRLGPDSWDCSGYATTVASMIRGFAGTRGGTTFSERGDGTRVSTGGRQPVVYGFRGSGSSSHMGIRILGEWWDAGSGGVENNQSDGAWEVLEIPAGLDWTAEGDPGRFTRSGGGNSGRGSDPGEDPSGAGGQPARRLTPAQAINRTKALMKRGFGSPQPLTATERADASIDARGRDNSLQDKQAGAAGRAQARAEGITSESKISAYGDRAVLETRKREIDQDIADVKRATGQVKRAMAATKKAIRKKYAELRKTRPVARRQRIEEAIDALRERHADLVAELRALVKQAADLQADAKEIGYDIGELNAEIAAMPNAEGGDAGADAGISADAQAQIDQANTNAATARRGQAISDSFLRTLFGSGSIDPRAGNVKIEINTLHPGDPAIQGEIASWIVGALGGQGSVPASAYRAGA